MKKLSYLLIAPILLMLFPGSAATPINNSDRDLMAMVGDLLDEGRISEVCNFARDIHTLSESISEPLRRSNLEKRATKVLQELKSRGITECDDSEAVKEGPTSSTFTVESDKSSDGGGDIIFDDPDFKEEDADDSRSVSESPDSDAVKKDPRDGIINVLGEDDSGNEENSEFLAEFEAAKERSDNAMEDLEKKERVASSCSSRGSSRCLLVNF